MKIQYPGVAQSITSDLANLKRLITLFDWGLPQGLYLDESMAAAEEELTRECDYRNEAENQRFYHSLVIDDPHVQVPEVIGDLSTQHILTTELVEGIPIDRLAQGFPQEVRNEVGQILLHLCLRELFEFRFMQTDPNWSNFLYNPNTSIVHLIDFGAARSYDRDFMDEYLRMIYACAHRDRQGVLDSSVKLGFLVGGESKAMLDAHVESAFIVGEPFATDEPYDFVAGQIPERVGQYMAVMASGRLTPPPKEAYTLHRKLSGAFLSCRRLQATVCCRPLFLKCYHEAFGV